MNINDERRALLHKYVDEKETNIQKNVTKSVKRGTERSVAMKYYTKIYV